MDSSLLNTPKSYKSCGSYSRTASNDCGADPIKITCEDIDHNQFVIILRGDKLTANAFAFTELEVFGKG